MRGGGITASALWPSAEDEHIFIETFVRKQLSQREREREGERGVYKDAVRRD